MSGGERWPFESCSYKKQKLLKQIKVWGGGGGITELLLFSSVLVIHMYVCDLS